MKELLGPYLVFMASTINGYEGTGRSLSLKLLEQLRQQSSRLAVTANEGGAAGRTLQECELKVNYPAGEPFNEEGQEVSGVGPDLFSVRLIHSEHPNVPTAGCSSGLTT